LKAIERRDESLFSVPDDLVVKGEGELSGSGSEASSSPDKEKKT
jgi:hypothetical protein